MDANNRSMTQTVKGFYQADSSPNARMTQIVGDGDTSFKETLRIDGSVVGGDNPFGSALGRAWDNLTVPVPSLAGRASFDAQVERSLAPPTACRGPQLPSAPRFRTRITMACLTCGRPRRAVYQMSPTRGSGIFPT